MTISAIVPVYNGAQTLPAVLSALAGAAPPPDEIIVVDDGSADESAAVAEKNGCRVIRLGRNLGAASAKNRGAAAAAGAILFFTDADVLVPRGIFSCIAQAFRSTACDGVVGLLDENSPELGFASQFKNLWMNFTYSRFASNDRIGLFYTSAAAIRRESFLALGGFDENYQGASVAEDTEFGQRAWANGLNIRLEPNLRVVHLKVYTVKSLLREDLARAAALTRMRLRKWNQPFFTSVPLFFQIAVPVLWLGLFTLAFAICSWILDLGNEIWLWGVVLVLALVFYFLNAPLLLFLRRLGGERFSGLACLFLPLDAIAVGLGILIAVVDLARGKRY